MLRAEAARQIATKRHVTPLTLRAKSGKIEIDPDCEVAVVTRGIYVQAWIFVSSEDIAEELGREENVA